jgi:DMSO/TMAO reductase YedYZ heme-binding membrane subunit
MVASAHSEPWWLVTRVTGFAAVVALVTLGWLGVVLARRGDATALRKLGPHRRMTWVTVSLLALHIGAALLDRAHVPPYAVVAPFMSPVRRVPAGTGSIATWGVVVVLATASGRRWFRTTWRRVHYLGYPAICVALVHSVLGSDGEAARTVVAVTVLGGLILLRPTTRETTRRRGAREPTSGARSDSVRSEPQATVAATVPSAACASGPGAASTMRGPRVVAPGHVRERPFALLGAPGLMDWTSRHPQFGPLVGGSAFGFAVFVYTTPLAYVGLFWAAPALGVATAALVTKCLRGPRPQERDVGDPQGTSARTASARPGFGFGTRGPAPAQVSGWLASPVPDGAIVEVRCPECGAPQSAWARSCSRCGADLLRATLVAQAARRPGTARRVPLTTHYEPEHLVGGASAGQRRSSAVLGGRLRGGAPDLSSSEQMAEVR